MAPSVSAPSDSPLPFPLARWQFVIGLVVLAVFIFFSLAARFTVPYRDDWDWLNAILTTPMSFRWLFTPHNEHVIPLARIIHALQYRLEGSQGWALFVIAVLAQLGIGAIFWFEIGQRWSGDARLFLTGLVTVFVFSTFQLQSIVFPAAILFPLVQFFALVAFTALLNAPPDATSRRTWWVGVATLATWLAALTTTNGFAAAPALALIAWRQQQRPRLVAGFAALTVTFGAAYLLLVGAPWQHGPPPAGQQWSSPSAGALASYFLTFYGSALAYASIPAAIAVGTLLFLLGVFAVLRTSLDGARAPRLEWFAAVTMIFAMASDGMATLGRAQFGPLQAAQSRYGTYAFVYHGALVLWWFSYAQRCRLVDHTRALAWTILLGSAALVPANVLVGTVWKAKADNITAAGLAVAIGVDDDEWIATLHPITPVVYEGSRHLREAHDPVAYDEAVGRSVANGALATCASGAATLAPIPKNQGWRVAGTLPDEAAGALLADRSGTVIGRVRPAPLITTPNPLEPAVVAAVVDSIRTGKRPDGWLGFARLGDGPPYALYPIDSAGQPLCRISQVAVPPQP